jgi:hypothetical protein
LIQQWGWETDILQLHCAGQNHTLEQMCSSWPNQKLRWGTKPCQGWQAAAQIRYKVLISNQFHTLAPRVSYWCNGRCSQYNSTTSPSKNDSPYRHNKVHVIQSLQTCPKRPFLGIQQHQLVGLVNHSMQTMYKEDLWPYQWYYTSLTKKTEENHKICLKTTSLQARIWKRDLPEIKQGCHSGDKKFWYQICLVLSMFTSLYRCGTVVYSHVDTIIMTV